MKRNFLKFMSVASLSLVFLGACASNSDSADSSTKDKSDTLVVYSPNSEGLINATIPAFEEKHDIKVELIQAGTGELFTKLENEKNSPVADIIFGGAYSQYAQSTYLFEKYISSENENIVADYQNTSGFYTPYTIDGSVFVVNPDLVGDIKIESYEDLLNPELKGKIASGDPANSSSAFAQLTNMLLAKGGYENKEAWKYVEDLYTNIDGKISSSSSNVYKTVSDGEMAVGLSYEDPTVKLLNDGANVEIVYPEDGTVFLPASAAIIKGSENQKNAQLFIDFIISEEIQNALGTTTTNRPVRENAETSDNMKPLDEINSITEDTDYVIKNKEEIISRYTDIFVDIESNK